jgi:hypothetical protein
VILAVGQKAVCAELDERGLIDRDRVSADFATMRTADPKVFAAGDGAFGGSTIVMAMHHGHRAAYYVKAHLEGRADPLPYRTPYRTRRVAVAQDPSWEVIERQHQAFHGLGHDPLAFAEIESGYDRETAKAEAARCYRCDAETGTHDYSVRTREDIFIMARTEPDDALAQRAILARRLAPRDPPHTQDAPASLDDLVFLPANLSRLVIDPYRDDCNLATTLAGIELAFPLIVGGFDQAPGEVRAALADALAETGGAYFGRRAPPGAVPWLQLVGPGDDTASAEAAVAIRLLADADDPIVSERAREGQRLGLVARAAELERVLPRALEAGLEVLVLDATGGLARPWVEVCARPDLTVLRDAIGLLRAINREEDIELVFFGGVRSGTDVAKVLGLGCRAAILGVAAGLAMGGSIGEGGLSFDTELTPAERSRNLANLLRACAGEASIMARCTGKTDVHNLEPEDLRSITIATSVASGIPLAGTGRNTRIDRPSIVSRTKGG